MGFLTPWFLAGLAAIGLPVYIHLLRRHESDPMPVSSLMFFERGTQSSTRHKRLRYLLLFALRALLLLLLALVFANPFIRRARAFSGDRLLVVAVDNSFSMRAGSRLDDARRGAMQLLGSRRTTQRAQIMALGNEVQLLTQPIEDAGALKAAIQSIQPSDSHGNFGELGRGMRALAETTKTPIELDLFSDMQSSNMPANFADMVMPANVTLVLHPVVASPLPNWTVESVDAPGQIVDPKKARVLAVIAGHGTPAASRTASLVVNGTVKSTQSVAVPANGRATVTFDGLDVPYGESRCEVRIDSADGFAADDRSGFAVKRADPERVLFVHNAGDTRSPLYFGAALEAAAQASFVLQSIAAEQVGDLDPGKYAFVVLSDVSTLPSIFENTLLKEVQNGGNVLIALGTGAAKGQRIPLFGEKVDDTHFYSRSGGPASAGTIDAAHPAMKDAAGWTDAQFFYAAVVDPGQSRVVAKLGDGTPLLLDKQIGQGHVLLLASGLDNVTNDLPLHPAFLPFVDQAARYLSGLERLSGPRLVDSYVQLRSATNEAKATGGQELAVEITGPDGSRPLTLQEAASAQSFQLTQAGFYQVRFANGREALIAANPDPRESSLDLIPDETLKLWSGNAVSVEQNETAGGAASTKTAYSLWWWLMLLVLVAALAESVVASGYLGTQREEA
jgi:hypothetical protein